ncbi:MAG: cysteine desulfurase-like protein [Rhodothermales bacterium]|nr:cysteine desulfurase-like protein [Rhodothermales bacterium]
MTASVEDIRSNFPALERNMAGQPVAYFDGPGGTQVVKPVVDAMGDYLIHHNANTHWAYPTSAETDAALDAARSTVAALLNAGPDEIAFGANMTTLTFHLSRALGRRWNAGDEVVVTELDHHANIDPWRALEVERGVVIRMVHMIPESGRIDMDHLEQVIGSRTRLVAVGAASNALGTVSDVERVVRMAKSVGALTFVDGVHSTPHALPDFTALGCDFFACSAYKFYGPHVGVLAGKRDVIDATDFPRLEPAPSQSPERAETGTLNHEGIVGTAAAIEWLGSLSPGSGLRDKLQQTYASLHERGEVLLARLWSRLDAIPGVTLFGPKPGERRTPTVAFALEGHTSEKVSRMLGKQGVFVTHGDFYAQTVVRRLGYEQDGLVRAGCACYTTTDEVDRLVSGVASLAESRHLV